MNMKGVAFNIIILSLIAISSFAQQIPQYSLQSYDKYKMNPAYAGMDFSLNITGVYRNQWQGINNNPTEETLNAHLPFYIWNGALGMEVSNDRIGQFRTSTLKLGYNYVMSSSKGLLGIGSKWGIQHISLNGEKLFTETGVYDGNGINHNDPILSNTNSSGNIPIIDLGIYFKSKKFELGISVDDISFTSSLGVAEYSLRPVYDIYSQYSFDVSYNFMIQPSIYIQTDLISLQSEMYIEMEYNKSIIGGVGLRGYSQNTIDAVYLVAGLRINKHFKILYSYDLGLSPLKNYYTNSHEIIMIYNLNKAIGIGVSEKVIYNPRFL